jgi:hypothetical protein
MAGGSVAVGRTPPYRRRLGAAGGPPFADILTITPASAPPLSARRWTTFARARAVAVGCEAHERALLKQLRGLGARFAILAMCHLDGLAGDLFRLPIEQRFSCHGRLVARTFRTATPIVALPFENRPS